MFLAETATKAVESTYSHFDIFMIVFTVLIGIGLVRLLLQRPRKNMLAIGFSTVALLIFVAADFKMVSGW
nr:hypothetical protein [Cohnella mopanensis]